MNQYYLVCGAFAVLALGACDDADGLDAATSDSGPVDVDASVGDAGTSLDCPLATLCGDSEIVVDATWLMDHLDDTDLQVIDTRGAALYDTSHIRGALRVDVGALRTTIDGVGGQVVGMAEAQAVFRAAGLRDDAAIVVYGPQIGTTSARLVWTLEYFSHARVALLDGGAGAWEAAAGATEAGAFSPVASSYSISAIDAERRVDVEYILPTLSDSSLNLVDARSSSEYNAGRLPGALSVDWTRNLAAGSLLADAELDALYPSLERSTTIATYCQTGSRASVSYVVLRALGFADVRLYDGSWSEWGARSELPREP